MEFDKKKAVYFNLIIQFLISTSILTYR